MTPYPLLLLSMQKRNKRGQKRKKQPFDIKTTDVLVTDIEPPKNMERFNHFLTNIRSRKKDSIRIIEYDDKGYPTTKTLDYDGNSIHVTAHRRFNDRQKDRRIYRSSGHQINRLEEGPLDRYYLLNQLTNQRIKILEVKRELSRK